MRPFGFAYAMCLVLWGVAQHGTQWWVLLVALVTVTLFLLVFLYRHGHRL